MLRLNLLLPIALILFARTTLVGAATDLPESMYISDDGRMLLQGDRPSSGLYDETVLRTIELNFTQEDFWEQMTANYDSEENIPADLVLDGETYPDVGVRFRGNTSYSRIGDSQKKSFNLEIDFTDDDQKLMGYKTLNLNNAASDPTFMREILYFDAVRRYTVGSKASFVKLLINSENWGLYVHVQQLNSDLLEEWFPDNDGIRWKAGMNIGGGTLPGGQLPPGGTIQLPQTYEEWAASDFARDLDGDGQIARADYQIFLNRQNDLNRPPPGEGQQPPTDGLLPPPTFDEWLASDQATDLNSDGQITEDDYRLFLQQQPSLPGAPPLVAGKLQQRQPGGQRPGGQFPGGTGGVGMFPGGDTALIWLGEDPIVYEAAYELKSSGTDDPWSPLIAACNVLNNTPLDQLADDAEKVMAVDRWLWFLAVENIFTDQDSYLTKGADYQLYGESETGRVHPLEHDGNESFSARSTDLSPFEGEDNPDRPAIGRLLSVPVLRQRYLAHVRTIVEESFDWNILAPKIAAHRALIETEVEADPKKLYTHAEFITGLSELETFVNTRLDYLLTHPEIAQQAPDILSVERTDPTTSAAGKLAQSELPSGTVRVTAEIGGAVPADQLLLHYATGITGPFTSLPMFDDGEHEDGAATDGLFAAEIPSLPTGSLVRYYVEARATDGTAAFSPPGAEHDVFTYQVAARIATSTSVVINELMADNDGVVQDPQGDYDDWIELHNTSLQEVDLSGSYLTDREDDLRKWAFPEGTVLFPGAYLIVWVDEDGGDEPGLHANFKLSNGGEEIYLVDTDDQGNAILDHVLFEAQETDISYGRTPDGTGDFASLNWPTPASSNLVPTDVSIAATDALPERFSLEPNYPNPFNSGTVISFALPIGGDVELAIFNLVGQKVAILAEGAYLPGAYELHWDGRSNAGDELATGVYLYRLQAGSQVQTRRLLLLR